MSGSRLFLQLGPSSTGKSSLLAHHLDGTGAQHGPWRNQQLSLWMGLADFPKGCQNLLLLPLMGGACQENALIVPKPQLIYQLLLFLLADIGVGLVEFGIARNSHQLLACPQTENVFRIHGGLHGKELDGVQHIIPDTVQITVSGHALFADAAIDHHHRNIHFLGSLQKVWPQLRLHRHKYPWPYLVQQMGRQPWQIKWKMNYAVRILNNAVGHFIAAVGKYRHQNRRVGKFPAKFLNQRTSRHNLTY